MHLRHYIQEWNIRARVELPTFPLPDGPQQREVTLYCEDRQMQITFASPEALPTVEAILTQLLFEAGLLEDHPTFPKWSQGLFDSPNRHASSNACSANGSSHAAWQPTERFRRSASAPAHRSRTQLVLRLTWSRSPFGRAHCCWRQAAQRNWEGR